MPVFATFDDLKRLTPPLQESQRILNFAASSEDKDVFLSHSYRDNELVPAVVKILEEHDGKTYVDIKDERLPKEVSVKTAQMIRRQLGIVKRFVLLVTTNSTGSVWMPWELGVADGQKRPYSVALFPVAQYSTEMEWANQEFLGLYQRIVWGQIKGYPRDEWIVWDHHANTANTLRSWLQS